MFVEIGSDAFGLGNTIANLRDARVRHGRHTSVSGDFASYCRFDVVGSPPIVILSP
jgi:hypothetical protein